MKTMEDILGGHGLGPALPKTSPPPVDPSAQGSPSSVGSVPEPPKLTMLPNDPSLAAGTDASKRVEVPSEVRGQRPESSDQNLDSGISNLGSGKSGAPRSKRHMSYVEMFERMHPQKPETAEERARREKRERSRAVLAAVGDGISALSNLWFTSQYAPNSFDGSRSMSGQTAARWDRLRREREAREKEYFDGWLRATAMDLAEEKEERNWNHTIEREKIADRRYAAKEERDRALDDLNARLRAQQISAAEADAEAKRIKAKYAEANERADLDYKNAGIRQRNAAAGAANASANASNAKAESYRNGGSGGKSKYTLTVGDKTYTYGTKEDYERAVERYASEYGVHPYEVYRDGIHTPLGIPEPKYTTKRKTTAQLAAEVERKSSAKHAAEQKEADFSKYEVHDDDEEDDDFSQFEMD